MPADTCNFRTVDISLRTIIGMAKSLNGEEHILRPYDYDVQFKSEVALATAMMKYGVIFSTVLRGLASFGIPANEFPKRTIVKKLFPKNGPLSKHFESIKAFRMTSDVGDIGFWSEGFILRDFLNGVGNLLLTSEEYISVMRSFIRKPTMTNFTLDTLSTMAHENRLYVNTFQGPEIIQTLSLDDVLGAIVRQRLRCHFQDERNSALRLMIPVPVSYKVQPAINFENEPISVRYFSAEEKRKGFVNTTLRESLTINEFKIYICSLSEKAIAANPDSAISSISAYGTNWAENIYANRLYRPLQDWLNNCATYFNDVYVSAIPEVRYVSFFEFEDQK